jgi:hypothetical protein
MDGRILLEWIIQNKDVRVGLNSAASLTDNSNKLSGSIKDLNFLNI